eukprot:TRINITY_DN945_c1_g1_i1.p1 TRINITY_DN945_c1_g1~~TRINITY_DN945_c1_g1_i1.p1  ORF type:complete len:460 (-),score=153.12 TRINITY_DN945_c1_g1_i1:209-1588(-)
MPQEKEKKDYSEMIESQLPGLIESAQGDLADAVEKLFTLEKQTRQGGDFASSIKICRAIVKCCFSSDDFKQLNDSLILIAKRRGQEKRVIQASVQEAMSCLELVDNVDKKIELINTLRVITEGKIFAELERAELTRLLAKITESRGEIKEAAKILQEVQVETLSKMEKKDKVDFILEQIRLCLDSNDYIRAQILSRKISPKVLLNDDFQEVKIRFYTLMNRFHAHEEDYLSLARSYQSIYNTPNIQEDQEKFTKYFCLVVAYGTLSPFGNEQNDLLNRFLQDKNAREVPKFKELLKKFLTVELMSFPQIEEEYKQVLEENVPAFASMETGEKLWEDFRLRIIQHNIRVISTYYNRITSDKFSKLLGIESEEAEKCLSHLVSNGSIYAKIDRIKGIICFSKPKDASEILNEWSSNVDGLLVLLEKTTHLIHRENMIHNQKDKKKRGGRGGRRNRNNNNNN